MAYCAQKFNGAVEKDHEIIKIRKMKNINEEAFLADVSGICCERMLSDANYIGVLVNKCSSLFSLITDKYATVVELHVSKNFALG